MSCVVAPLKCFAATLLFLPNSSHLFTSLNKESNKITVSGSFFLPALSLYLFHRHARQFQTPKYNYYYYYYYWI